MKKITVKEFRDFLNKMIDDGYVDNELAFGYDSNYACCSYHAPIKFKITEYGTVIILKN